MMDRVYADYNATTPLCSDVIDAMVEFKSMVGNLDSGHYFGQKMRQLYDETVDGIQQILGALNYDVFSCSSATEANNWFFHSILDGVNHCPRVIVSAIEHSCVLNPLYHYAESGKIDLKVCNVTQDGFIDLDHYQYLLSDDTLLVSVGLANNELGTIQPLADVCKLAKSVGAITHSDIVQAAGKMRLDLDSLMLDAVSLSAHKCYAPTGCGVLMVKDSDHLKPLLFGGSQQHRLRAGTVNVLGLVLFLKGLEYCYRNLDFHLDIAHWAAEFRNYNDKLVVISAPDEDSHLWNTVVVSILGKTAHDVMMALDMKNIAISTGSACSTGAFEPSHSIVALGLSNDITRSAIRISFGYPTSKSDLVHVKDGVFRFFN